MLVKFLFKVQYNVILVLCECLHNVLLGHDRVKVRDLENYRHILEDVLKKNSLTNERRALLLTKPGFELIHLIINFCFVHLSYALSTAKQFILIPENLFMKEQLFSSQILNDPRVQHAGAQFSFLNRMRPNENTNKEYQGILDTRLKLILLSCQKYKRTKFFKISTCHQNSLGWRKKIISLKSQKTL